MIKMVRLEPMQVADRDERRQPDFQLPPLQVRKAKFATKSTQHTMMGMDELVVYGNTAVLPLGRLDGPGLEEHLRGRAGERSSTTPSREPPHRLCR